MIDCSCFLENYFGHLFLAIVSGCFCFSFYSDFSWMDLAVVNLLFRRTRSLSFRAFLTLNGFLGLILDKRWNINMERKFLGVFLP